MLQRWMIAFALLMLACSLSCAQIDDGVPLPGSDNALSELLVASNLSYEDAGEDSFAIRFDNDVTLIAHEFIEFIRVYCDLGPLPGGEPLLQGHAALEAMRFNFSDPVGRLSAFEDEEGTISLFWECQIPKSAATPGFLRTIAEAGALQVVRWQAVLRAELPEKTTITPPERAEADFSASVEHLNWNLNESGLVFEQGEATFEMPCENGVTVRSTIYEGTVWTFAHIGGMPGDSSAMQGQVAIQLLKRNWEDPVGRLSLDDDDDVCWESQVPVDWLTPDYLTTIVDAAASEVEEFIEIYGDIPFNG